MSQTGGAPTLEEEQKPIIWQDFAENCLKIKNLDRGWRGACVSTVLLHPPKKLKRKLSRSEESLR